MREQRARSAKSRRPCNLVGCLLEISDPTLSAAAVLFYARFNERNTPNFVAILFVAAAAEMAVCFDLVEYI